MTDSTASHLAAYVWTDPERMGGQPYFRGTRLPERVLFECLSDGKSIDEFVADFEGVPREVVAGFLRASGRQFEGGDGARAA